MYRTLLTSSTIACFLALGIPTGSAAQNPVSAVGKATKDTGKAVVKGTKGVAKKTGEATQEATKKAATETKNAGKTAQGAVTPGLTSASCKDGTVQTGKTKKAACIRHGGLK